DKVKTPEQLFQLYLKSVGRGANLLLNVPPDTRGLISEKDSGTLIGFKKLLDESFENNLAKISKGYLIHHSSKKSAPKVNDGNTNTCETISLPGLVSVGIEFRQPQKLNCIVLKEYLQKGQNCKSFKLLFLDNDHKLIKQIAGTTIGRKRILTFPSTTASIIELSITDQKFPAAISEIEAYLINDKLLEK
ncbi:MAG: glycoside hydrolase family 29, partial [Chitinophagaceae bacterium]|nr:glycoside hydrolase family 29 [Chitinophagaceae bacterium]